MFIILLKIFIKFLETGGDTPPSGFLWREKLDSSGSCWRGKRRYILIRIVSLRDEASQSVLCQHYIQSVEENNKRKVLKLALLSPQTKLLKHRPQTGGEKVEALRELHLCSRSRWLWLSCNKFYASLPDPTSGAAKNLPKHSLETNMQISSPMDSQLKSCFVVEAKRKPMT